MTHRDEIGDLECVIETLDCDGYCLDCDNYKITERLAYYEDEAEKREQGCDFCQGEGTMSRKGFEVEMFNNKLFVSFADESVTSEALFKVNYCPMRGRKLVRNETDIV